MAKMDYNSINFKNSAIDKMSGKFGKGEPDSKKINFHESKDKTYQEVSYTSRPLHKNNTSGGGDCSSSNPMPSCSNSPNVGKYRNTTTKMKTLENDRRVKSTTQGGLRYI
jgi:hypothetical protein